MRVIESHIESKAGDPNGGEDAIVVTDTHIAVIDGTTSMHAGLASGLHAARLVAEAIRGLDAEATASQGIAGLTRALREAGVEGAARQRFSAVVAVFSRARREVWRVGDVHVAIGDVTSSAPKLIDESASRARAALLACLVEDGASLDVLRAEDPGREMILPLLRMQHTFRNVSEPHPLAYGAIDGNPVPERFVEVLPVGAGQPVALASDGYPILLATLEETEHYLREDLERDPLRISRHPTTKGVLPGDASFDDRAYVRFTA